MKSEHRHLIPYKLAHTKSSGIVLKLAESSRKLSQTIPVRLVKRAFKALPTLKCKMHTCSLARFA
jgi:hypothetical protein